MKMFFVNALSKAYLGVKGVVTDRRFLTLLCCVLFVGVSAFAQGGTVITGDPGQQALGNAADQIRTYIPYVKTLCYALAGVVALLGAISVYIAMNNEEQDVKKKIMMVVGACIFLIAAAESLPLFFGYTTGTAAP